MSEWGTQEVYLEGVLVLQMLSQLPKRGEPPTVPAPRTPVGDELM